MVGEGQGVTRLAKGLTQGCGGGGVLMSQQALHAMLHSDVLSWLWVGWDWHSYTHRYNPVISLSFIHPQGHAY